MRNHLAVCLAACVLSLSAVSLAQIPVHAEEASQAFGHPGKDVHTSTPIKHLVVIFQENVSFDHYFGTYPYAANAAGEPAFYARPFTPRVNGLTAELLNHNPNQQNGDNGAGAINPGNNQHIRQIKPTTSAVRPAAWRFLVVFCSIVCIFQS